LFACSKPRHRFLTTYVMVFFVFSELWWEVIIPFVDIVGIVDHHCLNFFHIMIWISYKQTIKNLSRFALIRKCCIALKIWRWHKYGHHYSWINVTLQHQEQNWFCITTLSYNLYHSSNLNQSEVYNIMW